MTTAEERVGGGSFAGAVSDDPDLARATGEVVGHALERVGFAPDLALLFVTAPVIEQLDDVLATVGSTASGCRARAWPPWCSTTAR